MWGYQSRPGHAPAAPHSVERRLVVDDALIQLGGAGVGTGAAFRPARRTVHGLDPSSGREPNARPRRIGSTPVVFRIMYTAGPGAGATPGKLANPSEAPMLGLNPPQRAAVEYCDGPLLVLAGAGSGKTRVIVEKIAHLIRKRHLAAAKIAAITFTNKAAREMRERVRRRVPAADAEGLTVCTFHALGLRFLQIEHARAGLRRNFSVFDADDSQTILKDPLPKGIKPDALFALQSLVSRAKNEGLSPEQAAERAQSGRQEE